MSKEQLTPHAMSHESRTQKLPERCSPKEKYLREKQQRDAYKKVFGIDVNIKPYPDKITPRIEKKLENHGFKIVYIGGIDLGTLKNLQKNGPEAHVDEIQRRYPKLKPVEKLSNKELPDPKVPRLLELGFWQDAYNGDTEFPKPLNSWVAFESFKTSDVDKAHKQPDKFVKKLGLLSRVNNSWNEITDAILSEGHNILSKDIGLPAANERMGLLSLIDRSILSNLTELDKDSKILELTNTEFKDMDGHGIYATSHADCGGAGCSTPIDTDYKSSTLGFRTAIFFELP